MKGMELEKRANKANNAYRKKKKALILKVPVPILLTRKGLVAQSSTVDYAGLIEGGQFIAFDAKETKIKTAFPLKNIHQHQTIYLSIVEELGGIGFFLIHFTELYKNSAFITPLYLVKKYADDEDARKSIPIKDFKSEWLVNIDNYLDDIDKIKSICKNER
jgi:recombination protein U